MNIPQIYLIEPYNAYAPQQRVRKPWEIIDEQALMLKIAEDMRSQQQQSLLLQEEEEHHHHNTTTTTTTATAAGFEHNAIVSAAFQLYKTNQGSRTVVNNVTGSLSGSLSNFLAVQFLNQTTNVEPKYSVNYRWIFGDGTTSTSASPTHSYKTGSFMVKLEATSSVHGNMSYIQTNAVSCSLS